MSLIYPNIVPPNNLRLPDALTIKHGPAELLSRFVLEGDKAAREQGIYLRLRHDFDELLYFNRQKVRNGTWYPLMRMFNPEYSYLVPENAYWISGENEDGEIVATHAGRVHYWPHSTLKDEVDELLYGQRDNPQPCVVTAADAELISGVVVYGGSAWVRPDYRGKRLSQLLPRLGRAYALARWPIEWGISIVAPVLVEKGVAAGYGYKRESRSIIFPGAPSGAVENVLVSVSAGGAYDDFATILRNGFSVSEPAKSRSLSPSTRFDNIETRISSDDVFHGSSSRS
jgi:GNAT superfamily N-acetyltransferase